MMQYQEYGRLEVNSLFEFVFESNLDGVLGQLLEDDHGLEVGIGSSKWI